jgi:hypothetical protein
MMTTLTKTTMLQRLPLLWQNARMTVFYSGFLFYRGFRRFFLLLPAVFREVYQKLETAVPDDPFVESSFNDDGDDVVVKPPSSWRVRITVSVLAAVVTGLVFLSSNFSMASSLDAAASEQATTEVKLGRMSSKSSSSTTTSTQMKATTTTSPALQQPTSSSNKESNSSTHSSSSVNGTTDDNDRDSNPTTSFPSSSLGLKP